MQSFFFCFDLFLYRIYDIREISFTVGSDIERGVPWSLSLEATSPRSLPLPYWNAVLVQTSDTGAGGRNRWIIGSWSITAASWRLSSLVLWLDTSDMGQSRSQAWCIIRINLHCNFCRDCPGLNCVKDIYSISDIILTPPLRRTFWSSAGGYFSWA